MDPYDAAQPCGLRIYGTLINASPATGTATGTLTAVTPGSAITVINTVITDSTQNWPVNGLSGLLVEITLGTSALQIIPIISNTATTLTVASTGTFASVGGTYIIRDWGTQITTPFATANALPAFNAAVIPGTSMVCININNCVTNSSVSQFRIENIKINPTINALNGLRCVNVNAALSRMWFGGSITSTHVAIIGSASLSQSVFTAAGNGTTVISASDGNHVFSANFFKGNGTGFSTAVSIARSNTTLSVAHMDGFYSPIFVGSGSTIGLTSVESKNHTAFGIRARLDSGAPNTATSAGSAIQGIGVRMSGGQGGCDFGQGNQAAITTLTVTSGVTGISLGYGSRVQLGSASSITGCTNEIGGLTTGFTTMAAVYALPNHALMDAIGSVIQIGP